MVKQTIRQNKPEPVMTLKRLESQKTRLEKSIQSMQLKLADLEMKIDEEKAKDSE
jgi:predicted  nucleic acid-binding Zn-ribbon protein